MQDLLQDELESLAAACLGLQTRRAARALSNAFNQALRPAGLNVSQFSALAAIAKGTDCTQAEIADNLALDESTLARSLAVLARRGLITTAGEGGRGGKRARLTPAGLALLQLTLTDWKALHEELRARFAPEDWERGMSFMRELEEQGAAIAGRRNPPQRGR